MSEGNREVLPGISDNVQMNQEEKVSDSSRSVVFHDHSRNHEHGTRSRKFRIIESGFVDWRGKDKGIYYDGDAKEFVIIEEQVVDAFVAVRDGVPKSFKQALCDPVWGEAARNEFFTLTNVMKTLVPVKMDDLKQGVKDGADTVVLFPVYESKVKEGKEVKKVRLVCNGKSQHGASETYSPTPTRTEFLVMMQIVAMKGWWMVHLDESRAFLSSTYKGNTPVFASVRGVSGWYRVKGALYGLKTSPRDYHVEVVMRLERMGFQRVEKCDCIFRKGMTVILDFVDDFILCGPEKDEIEEAIESYRKVATTTEPIWDPIVLLGHEIMRDRDEKKMFVSVKGKIMELVKSFGEVRKRRTPMKRSQYVVQECDLESLGEDSLLLDDHERRMYQKRVGSLVWISGVRYDIAFVVNYLTGYGQSPRVHHQRVVEWVVGYLLNTVEVSLQLGGDSLSFELFTDSSYGTGRNGRSVTGVILKLNQECGAILVKSVHSQYVRLSSFESELEAINVGLKVALWVKMIVRSIIDVDDAKINIFADNLSMIEFVRGNYELKASKHMEIKMHFVKEMYERGEINVNHVSGKVLPADKVTKVVDKSGIQVLRRCVQGCEIECEVSDDEDDERVEYVNVNVNESDDKSVEVDSKQQLGG